ncbi:hypothetical protein [Acinetobacter puyangensis]|uniref:hypothetical protein n=1 Tax=Acinetobacter puyangensis TaxID=1096779 RepID=UPI003A4E19C2
MNYRCPKCQSTKIIPMASATGPRPQVPKSLLILVPSILLLALLLAISIVFLILDKSTGPVLNGATILVVLSCIVSGFMFWRDLPNFKISMQSFMQSQKQWKCRECQHEWQNQ